MSKYTPDRTIEELAREQGVKPGALDDWLAKREPWTGGEDDVDIDEFLAEVRGRPHPQGSKAAS